MSDKEILEKAIQKATDGGWLKGKNSTQSNVHMLYNDFDSDGSSELWRMIIFRHDFAKALWGEHEWPKDSSKQVFDECIKCGDWYEDYGQTNLADSCWEYHLMQMVIAPDPIKYLGDNI